MTRQTLRGFGNEHESEALPGALPEGRFSPQRPPLGLYAEQLSSTAFTAPRAKNRRTWFYRIRPSVRQGRFKAIDNGAWATAPLSGEPTPPEPMRWNPPPLPEDPTDFVDGLTTYAATGDCAAQFGCAIHLYAANRSMNRRTLNIADGEALIVPQLGALALRTECGLLEVAPGEIAIIPRGLKFAVDLPGDAARGYVCENYGAPLELPERGPVGANGFANERDFHYPSAAFENLDGNFELILKFAGQLHSAALGHSPLDVVAWTGNSAPCKYDLARFNAMGSVTYDHPDPSINTVLTSPSNTPGVANLDLVVFSPRWSVAEDTFRPPWFHRNAMSEFMGLIDGTYDAKAEGFLPGGASLHNAMVPHGPDAATVAAAEAADLAPQYLGGGLAFMFESRTVLTPTAHAWSTPSRQRDYADCWQGLAKRFSPP